jgi:DNA (cytosine-5)-methyltransferase 1
MGIKNVLQKKIESLLKIKKLISYKDSKIFKSDIKFTILINKIEINLNNTRQYVQILNQTSPRYTFIDMFSGAGGLSQGLIEAGLTPELCIDDNTDSCKTLIKNHPNVTVVNSKVQNFNFSKFTNKVDVLVGGTPCQSFSFAGLRKGLFDENGSALLEFIKTIFLIRPKVFVIKNVKGLFSHDKGKTLQHIINLLSKDQVYKVEFELINMADYGIPQKRVRLFIIGSLKSANLPKFSPLPKYYKKKYFVIPNSYYTTQLV